MTVALKDLTWIEAEGVLAADPVLLLPLGAALKEHGPHLRLDNDLVLAERLADLVCERTDVVRLPALSWHRYPAFADYPGSVSLRGMTAVDLVVDIVSSLARHGARRFYVLNTGISTMRSLAAAAGDLAGGAVTLRFTNLITALGPTEEELCEQERGSHADETETSMMLHLAPDRVDMALAVDEAPPRTPGDPFVRKAEEEGTLSKSGVWGEPTRATAEKGAKLVEAVVNAAVQDIESLARVASK